MKQRKETQDVLVDFVYADGDRFSEQAALTIQEENKISAMLEQACLDGKIEEDWYVGAANTKPSTFKELLGTLKAALAINPLGWHPGIETGQTAEVQKP